MRDDERIDMLKTALANLEAVKNVTFAETVPVSRAPRCAGIVNAIRTAERRTEEALWAMEEWCGTS